tara:strand:- start:4469 stop:5317 length:849 start_codon:yes stop_codon:yes gene_type:complete
MNIDYYLCGVFSYMKTPWNLWDNVAWRFPKTESDLDVVFVVGAPRSGTTLVQKVLESHSRMISIEGETGLFSKQNIFDTNRMHFGYDRNKQLDFFRSSSDIVDFFEKCVLGLEGMEGGKVFIEKTPQHALYVGFIIKHFTKAKILHVVRDGRDCFASARRHPEVPQNVNVNSYAKYWRSCVSGPIKEMAHERVYNVRYEDLVEKPEVEFSKVMHFLDCDFEIQQIDPKVFGVDKRANLEEFKKLNVSINNSSVSRWKSDLTPKEANIFYQIAGKELTYYGYS